MQTYAQCHMKRADGVRYNAWIPIEFAEVGRVVDIKERGEWSRGWFIEAAYSVQRTHEQVVERSQDYKQTRKASDI